MTRPIAAVQLVLANGFGTQVLRWPNCLKGLQRCRGCLLPLPLPPALFVTSGEASRRSGSRISGEEEKESSPRTDASRRQDGGVRHWGRGAVVRPAGPGARWGLTDKIGGCGEVPDANPCDPGVIFPTHAIARSVKKKKNKPNASASWSGSDSPDCRCHLLGGASQAHTEPFSHQGAPQNAPQELFFLSSAGLQAGEIICRGIIWG